MKADAALPAGWTRRRWLRALPGGAAVLSAGAVPTIGAAAIAAPTPAPIDWPALVAVDGSPLDPAAWQGVPTVVVFWATYCAFCLRHNAHVERLHRTVDPARLRILGVALDRDAAGVRQYLRRHAYGFPVVLDGGQLRQRFTPRRVIPMTCTLDGDGRLLQCIPGEMAEDDVMQLGRLALPALR
ncbi:MAG: TlpA disulfide reductase family protein [Rubrivivax sp.]|nr:TlpA disulfide reductase family protein [Rubrivivax sp.]